MTPKVPKFISGRVTPLQGPDFCQDGATHLLHAGHGIVRLKPSNKQVEKQLEDAAAGGYDVIVSGHPTQGAECLYFRVDSVRPSHELAEQIAREMLSGSPPANEEVQAPPEGSKIARVDAVIAALESRTLTVSGHVPSTAARVVLVLDGEAPRKHIKYTVMYVDGMGGDQWKPFSLEIRVPEIGNGATVVGDGMTVDVRF